MPAVDVPPVAALPVERILVERAKKDARAMNDRPKNDRNPKAPYQRPQVVRVSLRPEEAVLGHCKISGQAGPVSASCTTLHCRTFGS